MKKKYIIRLLEIMGSTHGYISHINGWNIENSPVHNDLCEAKELLEKYIAAKRVKKPIITEIISKETIEQVKEFDNLLTLVDKKMSNLYSKSFRREPIKEIFNYDSNINNNTSILSMAMLTPYTVSELEEFYSITKTTIPHNMILGHLNKAGVTSLSGINTLIKMGYCNI